MNAFWAVLVVAVVASAVSVSESKLTKDDANNIIRCDTEGDQSKWKILESTTVEAKAKPLGVVERTITYPTSGTGKYELVCIRVLDQKGDGTGGHPTIRGGGVGFNYVTINFKSQRSRGFEFSVEIWGELPDSSGGK